MILTAALLTGSPAVRVQSPESIRIAPPSVSVRAEPRADAPILTSLKAGTRLDVHGVKGDWLEVPTFVGPVRVLGYVSKWVVIPDRPTPMDPVPMFGMWATAETETGTRSLRPIASHWVRIPARADSPRIAALAIANGKTARLPTAAAALITYVRAIADIGEPPSLSDRRQTLVVRFFDAVGINPDDFSLAIVRLVATANGSRVVGAIAGRVDQASRPQADWDVVRGMKQELVKAEVELADRGAAKIVPVTDLDPGEYAPSCDRPVERRSPARRCSPRHPRAEPSR